MDVDSHRNAPDIGGEIGKVCCKDGLEGLASPVEWEGILKRASVMCAPARFSWFLTNHPDKVGSDGTTDQRLLKATNDHCIDPRQRSETAAP